MELPGEALMVVLGALTDADIVRVLVGLTPAVDVILTAD